MEDKELHYEQVRKYFKKNTAKKKVYMWNIYTSTLDEILKDNSRISKVIDVGCGIGNFTLELVNRRRFKQIVGIDFLKEPFSIISENKKQFGNANFLQADMLNVPFKARSFELTACLNVFHHVHKEDLSKVIHELTRITNKYLILEIRNKNNILEFWYKNIVLPYFYSDLPQYTNSISEMNDLMKNKGFHLKMIKGKWLASWACRRLVLVYERIQK